MNRRTFLKLGTGVSAAALVTTLGLGSAAPALAHHGGLGGAVALGRGGKIGGAPHADIIAKTLGITIAELQSAVQSGKSIAEIAAEKNVSLDAIVNAIADEYKRQLDTAVAVGRLTQAQADTLLANLRATLPAQLQVKPVVGLQPGFKGGKGIGRGWSRGQKGGFGLTRGIPLSVAAEALGMTSSDLLAELRQGKSIADVAKEKDVSLDKVREAVVNAVKRDLDAAVSAGRITQARADAMLETLKANLPLLLQLKRVPVSGASTGGWMFTQGPTL